VAASFETSLDEAEFGGHPLGLQAAGGVLQLAENIRDVFFLMDVTNNRLLYVSPAYEEVYDRSRESFNVEPRSWIDAVHPDDRDATLASIERARLTGAALWVARTDKTPHDSPGAMRLAGSRSVAGSGRPPADRRGSVRRIRRGGGYHDQVAIEDDGHPRF
jgi:PAS domain-containing protein